MHGEVEEQFRLAKRQHNAQAPVSQLPEELLSEIFILARDASAYMDKMLPPASHVCQEWRGIALRCPALWTSVDCMYLRLVEELLPRARTLPIDLTVGIYKS